MTSEVSSTKHNESLKEGILVKAWGNHEIEKLKLCQKNYLCCS